MDTITLGRIYINHIDPIERRFCDRVIAAGTGKLPTIMYLREKLNISLTEAKTLYEGREEFLKGNPFGW